MRRLICGFVLLAALLGVPSNAQAITGFLVSWTVSTSVTGRLVYVCIYNVMGSIQQVNLPYLCPASLDFQ
jgi:hypothetical protein